MGGVGSGRKYPDHRALTTETPSLGITKIDREGDLRTLPPITASAQMADAQVSSGFRWFRLIRLLPEMS